MKETIKDMLLQVRDYRSRAERSRQPQCDGETEDHEELEKIKTRVAALGCKFFDIVDEDLARIREHLRHSEASVEARLAALQKSAVHVGVLLEESRLHQLEKILPVPPESRAALCQHLLELRMRSEPAEVREQLECLVEEYNGIVDACNEHSQYMEINVAGFRKILKQHEKQIPLVFHARAHPFLGFHCLVTRTWRRIHDCSRQLGAILEDACARLGRIAEAQGLQGAQRQFHELRCLGAECQMVMDVQKSVQFVALQGGPLGTHYSKPVEDKVVQAPHPLAEYGSLNQSPLEEMLICGPPNINGAYAWKVSG